MRRIPRLVTDLAPGQIADAEKASGLAAGTLGLLMPGELAAAGYLRTGGSRYCPQCLADSDGIWPLRWRMAWVFSCPRHARLLRDTCQECGGVQRVNLYVGRRGVLRAFCCPRPVAGGGRCTADLRLAEPGRPLTPSLTATAAWIESLYTDLVDPAAHAHAAAVFADLPIVAVWLARRAERRRAFTTQKPVADTLGRVLEARVHRDGELTAALLAQAHQLMTGAEREAIAQLRTLLREEPTAARIPPPGMPRESGTPWPADSTAG